MKKSLYLAIVVPVLIYMLSGCTLLDLFKSEPVVIKREETKEETEMQQSTEISEEEVAKPAEEPIDEPEVVPETPEVVPEPPKPAPPATTYKADTYYARAAEIEGYEQSLMSKTSDQATMNNDSHIVFQMWDGLLNEVYQHLKSTMPKSEFNALESDELDWIVEKEAAMDQVRKEYEGGSIAPLMVNSTATQYTKERCYYLISLVND